MSDLFHSQAKKNIFETISLSLLAARRFSSVHEITDLSKYGEH